MSGMLDGDVILLAGATGRVGGATLAKFAAEGARVLVVSRSIENAAAAIAAHVPPAAHAHIVPFAGDLREAATGDALVHAALERFGRIDAAINLSGRGRMVPLRDSTLEDLRTNLDAFVVTAYNFALPAVRQMLQQPLRANGRSRGHIVTVTAGSSRDPQPSYGLFGSAKAAVNILMRAIAREHKADGIVANALVLGGVATEAARKYLDDEEFRAAVAPEEIAAILAFLAGGDGTGINGELIDVNAREVE